MNSNYSIINFANHSIPLSIESIRTAIEINPAIIKSIDDKTGLSLLIIAIEQENYQVTKYLLDKGGNINLKNESGQSLLHIAVEKSNNKIINLLLERDINPNVKDNSGNTPMHIAALNGEYKVIKLLLLYLGNPFIKNALGFYPIDYAKETNHLKSYNVLLNYHSRSSKNISSIAHLISPIGNKPISYENINKSLTNKHKKCSNFKRQSKFKETKLWHHKSCSALPCHINIKEVNDIIEPSSYEDEVGNNHRVIVKRNNEICLNGLNTKCDSNIELYDIETEECSPSSKDINLAFEWNQTPTIMTKQLFNQSEKNTSNGSKNSNDNNQNSYIYSNDNKSPNNNHISQLKSNKDMFSNGKLCHCYHSTNNNINDTSPKNNKQINNITNNNNKQALLKTHQYEITNEEIKQIESNIYLLLKEIQMERYSRIFIKEGFDDINTLLSFIHQPNSYNELISKSLNIIKPGDRARIMIKLQEISDGFDIKIPSSVYYYTNKSYEDSQIDQNIIKLNNWLMKINLNKYSKHIFNAGYHSIELLWMQMYSKHPLTEGDIINYFNVNIIGYRTRLMNQLIEDSSAFITQLKQNTIEDIKEINKEKENRALCICDCIIY